MKFGILLSNQQYLQTDMVSALEEQLLMLRHARDKGWDSYFGNQHYLQAGNLQMLQLVPYLARLHGDAGEMMMGVGLILLTLQNPVHMAETIASLDVIARGNLAFGVGLGYRDVEFDAFGIRKGHRVRRFEECLELIKRLWTEEEVSFENEVWKLDKVTMNLKPVQKPRPPIWFAGKHPNAVRRAARLGDCLYPSPQATMADNRERLAIYLAELLRVGKPFPTEIPGRREIFVAKDRATAFELAAPYLSDKYRLYAQWQRDQNLPPEKRLEKPFEELVRDRFVIGSPEDCYNELRPYIEELGINHLIFRTHFIGMPVSTALSSMRLISDELIPALRQVQPRPLAEFAREHKLSGAA